MSWMKVDYFGRRWFGEDFFFKEDNKTFCALPFTHSYIHTNGDVKPCCIAGLNTNLGNVNEQTIEEIFNGEEMKKLRVDLLNGVKRPEYCSDCYTADDNGFNSARTGNNFDLAHLITPSIEAMESDGYLEPKIKSWDIRYSNLCNLKCRTCGDMFSTTWSKENSENIGTVYEETKAYKGEDPLKNQYQHVEKIYFAGGEPLIMPEHYACLTKLIDIDRAKEVSLYYNTNMTKLNYNKHSLLDYWKEFKQIQIGISIDSFGDRANYIRNGSVKWNKIEQNIKTLYGYAKTENSRTKYTVSPTISLMNVYTLTDMHKFLFENNLILRADAIMFNVLYFAPCYSVKLLPKKIKKEIQDKFANHIEWLKDNGATDFSINQYSSLSNYLEEEFPEEEHQRHLNEFITTTKRLDSIRGESFSDTFPEYREWWEEITKNTISVVNLQ